MDPSCTYRNNHWCGTYGNSYYASFLGAYDQHNQEVLDLQVAEMKRAGLDGLWIDYQLASWDDVIDRLVETLQRNSLGFAIHVDSASNPNVLADRQDKIMEWVKAPHYFRVHGLPVVPVFNSASTVFTPLPTPAIYLARWEVESAPWANGSYPWLSPSLDAQREYYDWGGSDVSVGAAFRGFADCYASRTLALPYVDMLQRTLDLAAEYQPDFVQLLTWNDYTEGTMLEPSWIRKTGECVDVCQKPCLTTDHCHSNSSAFRDCSKPYGAFEGPGHPDCRSSAKLSARGDLELVRRHIAARRAAQ